MAKRRQSRVWPTCDMCKTDQLEIKDGLCWRCRNTMLDFETSKHSPLKPYEVAQNFADHLLTESGERVWKR